MAQEEVDLRKVKIEIIDKNEEESENEEELEILAEYHGVAVPRPYVHRKFKPIMPYITAPTIGKRRKNSSKEPAASPTPHILVDAEFRFYDAKGPYEGNDLVLEDDLIRKSPRSLLPRVVEKEENKVQSMIKNEVHSKSQESTPSDSKHAVVDVSECLAQYGIQPTNSLQVSPKMPPPPPHPYPTEKNRLTIIYSYPHHGTTSLFGHFMQKISQEDPGRWIRYINLGKASKIMEKAPRNSWTLSKFIISNFSIKDQAEKNLVQSFFYEYDRVREDDCRRVRVKREQRNTNTLVADVFLDELDEMSSDSLDTMLNILKKINWNESTARVWVTARTHLKPKIDETVISWLVRGETWIDETLDCYEMLPISSEEQISFLYKFWKIKNFEGQEKEKRKYQGDITDLDPEDYEPFWQRLKTFVRQLYYQLEGDIPYFYRTLGACPFHMIIIAGHFTPDLIRYFDGESVNSNTKLKYLSICLTSLLDEFVRSKFEYFFKNHTIPNAGSQVIDFDFKDNLFRKVSRLHLKLAINSYEQNYVTDCRQIRHILSGQAEDELELYLMGLVNESNGETKFLHELVVDFLLAQYYVDYGRQKNTGVFYINFFLNNILFEDKCERIRKFFNEYLTLQQKRGKIKGSIIWQRLRQFLIQHYRLEEEEKEVEIKVKLVKAKASPKKKGKGSQKVVNGEEKEEKVLDDRLQCASDPMLWEVNMPSDEEPVLWKVHEEQNGVELAGPSIGNRSQDEKQTFGYKSLKNKGSVLFLALIEGNMAIAHILIDSFKGSTETLRKFLDISAPLTIFKRYFPDKSRQKEEEAVVAQMHVTSLQALALFGKGEEMMDKLVRAVLSALDSSRIKANFEYHSWTALHFAAMNSNWEFLRALLSAIKKNDKVDMNALSPTGATPLHMVLMSNSWFYVMEIMDHPHPGCSSSDGDHDALLSPPKRRKTNSKTVVNIDHKLRVDEALKLSKKILKYEGIVKRFYKIEYYDKDDLNDPSTRHILTIDALLNNGASLNEHHMLDESTILHQAAALESPIIMKYLIEKGANQEALDKEGKTPIFYLERVTKVPQPIPGLLDFPPKGVGLGMGAAMCVNRSLDDINDGSEISSLLLD